MATLSSLHEAAEALMCCKSFAFCLLELPFWGDQQAAGLHTSLCGVRPAQHERSPWQFWQLPCVCPAPIHQGAEDGPYDPLWIPGPFVFPMLPQQVSTGSGSYPLNSFTLIYLLRQMITSSLLPFLSLMKMWRIGCSAFSGSLVRHIKLPVGHTDLWLEGPGQSCWKCQHMLTLWLVGRITGVLTR